jgi:hypothetical protein
VLTLATLQNSDDMFVKWYGEILPGFGLLVRDPAHPHRGSTRIRITGACSIQANRVAATAISQRIPVLLPVKQK